VGVCTTPGVQLLAGLAMPPPSRAWVNIELLALAASFRGNNLVPLVVYCWHENP
jgi:hypothetical protein